MVKNTELHSNATPIIISEINVTIAPLISQYAHASYLRSYSDPHFFKNQPIYIATKRYSEGNYVAFEIKGNSMDNNRRNAICNGDVVLGRELAKDCWRNKLHTPKVFIIVHKEKGIILKEIVDHDLDRGIITCHSFNPDKEQYPDITINLTDTHQLFHYKELRRE